MKVEIKFVHESEFMKHQHTITLIDNGVTSREDLFDFFTRATSVAGFSLGSDSEIGLVPEYE